MGGRAQELPRLVVEVRGEVDVEGIAGVTVSTSGNGGGGAAEFLDRIDPKVLEQVVLNRGGDFAPNETPGQAFLGALREMARGRSGS